MLKISKKQQKDENDIDLEATRDYYVDLYRRLGYKMKNGVRHREMVDVLRGMLIEQILELQKLLKSKYLPKSDRRQVERTLVNLIDSPLRTMDKFG